MELQQAGEDDIAKVVKRARKQGLVEGNVRWLRKAACVSQSVKRDLISPSSSRSRSTSTRWVSWLAVAGITFWSLPFFFVGFGTRVLFRCVKFWV